MIFLDLFAGIGGFRLALERAGHKCIGFCEIDKFARQTYKANFNTEGEVEWHDITQVTDEDVRELGRVDIITGGFPCQTFSVAGHRRGIDDARGTLFYEIARIAAIAKPKFLLLENVRGLLSSGHRNTGIFYDKSTRTYKTEPGEQQGKSREVALKVPGETFLQIQSTLSQLDYMGQIGVLNSKDFGVPQNRERVFFVGHLRGQSRREIFPITGTNGQALTELTQGLADAYRVYDPAGVARTLKAEAGGVGAKTGLYAVPVLTPDRAEKRQNGRRFKTAGEPMLTLTSQDRHGVLINRGEVKTKDDNLASCLDANYYKGLDNHGARTGIMEKPPHIPGPDDVNNTVRSGGRGSITAKHNHDTIYDGVRIRRLTPLETFRLQGFPDSHHDNAKAAGVSDSQLYKQAGNAVTVNVVYEIAKRLG